MAPIDRDAISRTEAEVRVPPDATRREPVHLGSSAPSLARTVASGGTRTSRQRIAGAAGHASRACLRLLTLTTLWLIAHGAGAATQERPDERLRVLLKEAVAKADSFEDRFDAEVWLTDMAGRLAGTVDDDRERVDILRHVHREARRADLEPELVLAVIHVESNFDRFAISSAGARGLMQVMPFWLDEIGRPGDNLFQIRTNLRYGCTILRYYLDRERGNLERALARYNGSVGQNWYPRRVFRAWQRRWFPQ